MIAEKKGVTFQYLNGIKGLLLTLNKVHPCHKAEQIESVAKSNNKSDVVIITCDVHTHAPAPNNVQWFTIELHSGDDTPETIHVYVIPYAADYLAIDANSAVTNSFNKPDKKAISVENTLREGIDWY